MWDYVFACRRSTEVVGASAVVAERLGHASPSVTLNVYSHVTPSMQKEAAAALERVRGARMGTGSGTVEHAYSAAMRSIA